MDTVLLGQMVGGGNAGKRGVVVVVSSGVVESCPSPSEQRARRRGTSSPALGNILTRTGVQTPQLVNN